MLLNIKYPCYGHKDLKAAILLYTNSQFSRVDISNSKAPKNYSILQQHPAAADVLWGF